MPYTTKYTIETTQPVLDDTIRVSIQERDYSGSSTELDPGDVLAEITYTPIGFYGDTPHWNVSRSVCRVGFYDDTTGKLAEVLSGDDEQYKILVENTTQSTDLWSGFVINDSYSYRLYQPGISYVRATDRIEDLQSIPYSQGGGVFYAGRATLLEVLTRCLDSTSLSLGFATHMNWFPHIGTNDLDTTDDPMVNLRLDQDNFFDDDGNPFSKFTVLEQVLMRFQLQLFQCESRWFVIQRKRNVFGSGTDVFKTYNYTSAGVADSPSTTNQPARKEVSVDTDSGSFFITPAVVGSVPYGSVKSTYYHKDPFDGLFSDLSFEVGLQDTVGGTPLVDEGLGLAVGATTISFDGVTASVNIPADRYFRIDSDSTNTLYKFTEAAEVNGSGEATDVPIQPPIQEAIADNDAITFYEDIGGWERFSSVHSTTSNGQNLTDDDVKALRLDVEFAASDAFGVWVRQQSKEEVGGTTGQVLKTGWNIKASGTTATTDVFFAYKIYVVGTSTTWYHRASDTTWQTSDPGVNKINMYDFGWLDDQWHKVNIVTDDLNDGSNDIQGDLFIEFYEGREDDTGGSQTIDYIYVDNVDKPVIILSDGTPSNEATQVLLTYNGNVNRAEPALPTLISGDGPSSSHISRLTVYDSAGAEQSITSNWSYLPSVSDSGFSLDQFWSNQLLKEFSLPNRKIRGDVFVRSDTSTPRPFHYLVVENPNNTAKYDYTWQDLIWRPASHTGILSGTFVQFQEGRSADRICSVDVKPNTSLLSSIDPLAGLVCDSTEAFTPVEGATHVYWVDDGGALRKAAIQTSLTWTITELDTITSGRDFLHVRVDQAAGYIFTLENNTSDSTKYIVRRNLDGGDETTIVTLAYGSYTFTQIAVDRVNSQLFVVYESVTPTTGFEVRLYDYTGTLDSTYGSEATGDAGWPCITPDGVDYWYRYTQGATDELRKNGVDLTHNSPLSTSTGNDTMLIDKDDEKIFIFSSGSQKIVSLPISGGSESDVVTGLVYGNGMGFDRLNQKLYYNGANGDIYRCDYDGSNAEEVVDGGVGPDDIQGICLGV